MKVAVYVSGGVKQIVLTPENEWEKSVIEGTKDFASATLLRGSFYECQGGWVRQGAGEESLIFRMDKPSKNGWDSDTAVIGDEWV